MALKTYKPVTNSQRQLVLVDRTGLHKGPPVKTLTKGQKRPAGRNNLGRITSFRKSGGHKRTYRMVDFKRRKLDVEGKVERIEYDPNRSANIALIAYTDGVKAYIIAPKGLKPGDTIFASDKATTNDFNVGNSFPLSVIPPSTLRACSAGYRPLLHPSAASLLVPPSLLRSKKMWMWCPSFQRRNGWETLKSAMQSFQFMF